MSGRTMETHITVGELQNALEEASSLDRRLNFLGTKIAARDPRSLGLDAARSHLDGFTRALRELQRYAEDADDYFRKE